MFKFFPFFANILLHYKSKSFWLASETWITVLSVISTIAMAQGWVTEEQWTSSIYPAALVIIHRLLKKGLVPPPQTGSVE